MTHSYWRPFNQARFFFRHKYSTVKFGLWECMAQDHTMLHSHSRDVSVSYVVVDRYNRAWKTHKREDNERNRILCWNFQRILTFTHGKDEAFVNNMSTFSRIYFLPVVQHSHSLPGFNMKMKPIQRYRTIYEYIHNRCATGVEYKLDGYSVSRNGP